MFQHIVTAWRIDRGCSRMLVRTCKTRLDTTTKFMVIVTSLFSLISSFPDNMFYHVWTWLLFYHDGSNNVVQVCSFIKPWTVCSNYMHKHVCQQHCSSWPAQPCSSLSAHPCCSLSITLFKLASSTMFYARHAKTSRAFLRVYFT